MTKSLLDLCWAEGLPVSFENLAESSFASFVHSRESTNGDACHTAAAAQSMLAALVLVGLVVVVNGKSYGAFEIHIVCSSPFVQEGESRDVSHCSAWNPDVASFGPDEMACCSGAPTTSTKETCSRSRRLIEMPTSCAVASRAGSRLRAAARLPRPHSWRDLLGRCPSRHASWVHFSARS